MSRKLIALWLFLAVLLVPRIAFGQPAAGFTKITNVSATTFVDSSCPNLTACYYQVTALDSGGFESVPSPCSTTTLCISTNVVVAIMPSSGTHTVTLTWNASSTASVTYNVYRHIGPFSGGNLVAVVN